MPDEIRITITKGGQVVDSVGLAFATREEMPSLPIDALDAMIASAVWHLVTDFPDEFIANEDGSVRWWWVNPVFNPAIPATEFDPENPNSGNPLRMYADLTPERCVSVALRMRGKKIVAGRNLAIANLQATQQANAGSDLIDSAVTVTE